MALLEFISRSPSWLTTINATEGGSIFGKRIESMKFVGFFKKLSGIKGVKNQVITSV